MKDASGVLIHMYSMYPGMVSMDESAMHQPIRWPHQANSYVWYLAGFHVMKRNSRTLWIETKQYTVHIVSSISKSILVSEVALLTDYFVDNKYIALVK